MNQEQLLAKRDELVREYHLGELELYCTPMTSRGRARFSAVVLGLVLAITVPIFLLPIIITKQALDIWSALGILGIMVSGCFVLVLDFLTNRTSVYVYTNGLVFFNRKGGRVVHWKEIRKVWIYHGENSDRLFAELNDDSEIRFPESRSRDSASDEALEKFIEAKMAQTSRTPDGVITFFRTIFPDQ